MAEFDEDVSLLGEPILPPRVGLNKPLIYGLGLGVLALLLLLLLWAVSTWVQSPRGAAVPAPVPDPPGLQTPAPRLETWMPDPLPTTFAHLDRRPKIPEALLLDRTSPPPPPAAPAPPPGSPAGSPPAPAAQPPSTPAPAAAAKPKRPQWSFLAQGSARPPATALGSRPPPPKGAHLIDPAVWAIPENPARTLYRSQVLACEILQKIDSDAPGQIQLALTVPAIGFYGQGEELFPKASKVIALPAGKPEHGATTIEVKLEQVHLPSGIVVEIPGTLGNADGSNQLTGKVNNHWGELVAAAAINALVNLGGGYLVGTPGRGQFYQDPAQQALQDATQSVQQDVKSVVGRTLRRGPTITRDPQRGEERFCTIQMLKNIQFGAHPVVVKP